MSITSNAHHTLERRLDIEPAHQAMTRYGSKFNAAATTLAHNDRYLGGQPWSSALLKFDQSKYREPSNRFGFKFIHDKEVPRVYPTAGMLNQVHASAGPPSLRTMPVRAKYNVTV